MFLRDFFITLILTNLLVFLRVFYYTNFTDSFGVCAVFVDISVSLLLFFLQMYDFGTVT